MRKQLEGLCRGFLAAGTSVSTEREQTGGAASFGGHQITV